MQKHIKMHLALYVLISSTLIIGSAGINDGSDFKRITIEPADRYQLVKHNLALNNNCKFVWTGGSIEPPVLNDINHIYDIKTQYNPWDIVLYTVYKDQKRVSRFLHGDCFAGKTTWTIGDTKNNDTVS